MLTGHPPFTCDNPLHVLWQHQYQPAPAVAVLRPDTPADLDTLIARMLAKNPADRPATAAEVRDRLTLRDGIETAAAAPTRALSMAAQTQILPVLDDGEQPAAVVGRRSRLGPGAIAAVALGVAILAAVAVALLVRPGTDPASTAADNQPPSSATTASGTATADNSTESPGTGSTASAPDTATTETFAENPGAAALARLAALIGVIEEQWQAGGLDGEAADELTKKLEPVGREVTRGDTGKAAEKLTDFGSKLDELHQDGKITTAAYDAVQASLTELADTLPRSEENKSGKNGSGKDGSGEEE
jgi:eukaryotic-like serine/threonine-protein kinase